MSLAHRPFPKIASGAGSAGVAGDWVATEKIHGAQLVIGVDREEARVGKRKAWLDAHESFFEWQMLRPALLAAARQIHGALGARGTAWIYAELFGGAYPHPEVHALSALTPVQTGIWYAPTLRVAVFDVLHETEDGASFVGHDALIALTEQTPLMHVPVLGRGPLAELQRLPVRFPTQVPARLGYPPLACNWAEGHVLKPAARMRAEARPVIKHKIPELDEKRFDESRPRDPHAYLSIDDLRAVAAALVNPARLASARSRVGRDREQVIEETVLDCLVDLEELFPLRVGSLTADEESALIALLTGCARTEEARTR